MTPVRSIFSWLFSKVWAFVAVFVILWLGAWVVGKFQELNRSTHTIGQLESIEDQARDAAKRAITEAQARIDKIDQAAQDAVERRVQNLNDEIRKLGDQLPSPAELAIAAARGDTKTISDWATRQVTIQARQEERDVLVRIRDYRSKLSEYERWTREGPTELERLRLEHVALLDEIRRLDDEIEQLRKANQVMVHVPGSWQSAKLKVLQAGREDKVKHTHQLKGKHEELSAFLRTLPKPDHPGTLLQDPKIGPVLEELRRWKGDLETRLRQDWVWRLFNVDLSAADIAKAAVVIVVVATVTPVGIKLFLYYVLAPVATRRSAVALLPNSGGRVLTGRDLPGQASSATSAVSCRVTIDSSSELLVHPQYLQSLPHACETRTQWILNRHIPLSSIAAGLCALTRVRARSPQTVVVSSTRDPLSEVSLIAIPEGSCAVVLPRHIVGVLQTRGAPPRITRHWRLTSLHAWLTLQLRYLVFHGPVTLVVKGCRGVRVEAAETGRSINPVATVGFSANLRYASRRCETFYGYLSGQKPLLNDSFAGGGGYYIYQEMPYQGRGGLFGRGLEGLMDALLKPLGI